jgi:hypothetical protein
MNAEVIAHEMRVALPEVKTGSLRMWGEWFGRPYDSWHKITGCSAVGSVLLLAFNEGETLRVDNPEGLEATKTAFSIRSASAVRWEWFYYGKPRIADNLYFYQFIRNGQVVEAQTNADWYSRKFTPSASANAAELL